MYARDRRASGAGTSAGDFYVVMNPDFVVRYASDEYLAATLTSRRDIVGCRLFDAFPDNPNDTVADGVANLRASLTEVLKTGDVHRMPLQKYDVQNRLSRGSGWVEKYWAPTNIPVYASGSREVVGLIHRVRDMTEVVRLSDWLKRQQRIMSEQRVSARHDLELHAREVERALQHAEAMLKEGEPLPGWSEETRYRLGASPARLEPGDRVPVCGLYHALHEPSCGGFTPLLYANAGRRFAPCGDCGRHVRYRLVELGA